MDSPERGIGSGGECCRLFCFAFTFTFIFALTFSSRGVRGTGVRGCVFAFTFAFAFVCPFLCPCLCPLEGLQSPHLPYTHLLPTPHLMVIRKTSLQTNLTPIASPAASLGILSGSQSGSSSLPSLRLFFLLHAAKVRSSCEEGPGQSALQSAYHDPKLDVTESKQHRTP